MQTHTTTRRRNRVFKSLHKPLTYLGVERTLTATIPTANVATFAGQQQLAAQGATVDLGDSVAATELETIGTIKANQTARQADITALENATNTADPSQESEMAVLQRINRALLLQLRTMQDTNQINANAALQQMLAQKQQQDAMKSAFRDSAGYESFYNANITTTSSGAANLLTAELRIEKPNILPVECQTDTHRKPVTFDDLLKAALRWRPDRIILGEVRGIEARTLLDSFNTGHAGSLATIHANSAAKALRRFANLVLRSHSQATFADIEAEIGESVDFVVHVAREPGRRVIREVLRLNGYNRALQRFNYEMVYGADTISNPNHFPERKEPHNAVA